MIINTEGSEFFFLNPKILRLSMTVTPFLCIFINLCSAWNYVCAYMHKRLSPVFQCYDDKIWFVTQHCLNKNMFKKKRKKAWYLCLWVGFLVCFMCVWHFLPTFWEWVIYLWRSVSSMMYALITCSKFVLLLINKMYVVLSFSMYLTVSTLYIHQHPPEMLSGKCQHTNLLLLTKSRKGSLKPTKGWFIIAMWIVFYKTASHWHVPVHTTISVTIKDGSTLYQ